MRFYSALLVCLAMCSIFLAVLLISMMMHYILGTSIAHVFIASTFFLLLVFCIVYKHDRYQL